jgi:hypothetical protein
LLGLALQNSGQLAEAEAVERESLVIKTQLLGPDSYEVWMSLLNPAVIPSDRSDLLGAETNFVLRG